MAIRRFYGAMIDDNLDASVMFAVGIGNERIVSCFISDREVQIVRIFGENSEEKLKEIREKMPQTGKGSYIWEFITKLLKDIIDGAEHGKAQSIDRHGIHKEVK